MITRSQAKMASSGENSNEFDVNNQMGYEQPEDGNELGPGDRNHKKLEEVQKKNESGIKELSKELKKQAKENKETREKDRKEWQEAITNTQQQNQHQIESVEQQVRSIKEAHRSTEDKIKEVSTEKGRELEEITNKLTTVRESQQRVQRRLEEMEQRPAGAMNAAVINKEATFDGEDNFPMEFLKELREIQETYYGEENTRWIGRHLTGEAALWWRIVREQIKSFQEFEEAFTSKYWSATQQERVRDQLEYGRFNSSGNLDMIQYMERCVLKSRQLIPILSDKHMITKLARHYNREIQIAVVTRVSRVPTGGRISDRGRRRAVYIEAMTSDDEYNEPGNMEEKVGGVEEEINKKIGELEGHCFRVTDSTPYLQKGWPVPIKHQRAVQEEIKRMLDYGVIERANSPYVQPLVTMPG
ncbi:hypothetical protein L0F63_007523, partial [Massospora cicadina]